MSNLTQSAAQQTSKVRPGTPAISIVTIVYNGMPYLQESVESVLAQNFQDWELLISDDGSNDGSREYLQGLTDPRIRVTLQPKNLGIFGNLNFLFKHAAAPLSQILCQDDYFYGPNSLQRIIDYWKTADPVIGFATFNRAEVSSKHQPAKRPTTFPDLIYPENAAAAFFIFGNLPGNLSNCTLKTSIVEELGWFNQSLPYAGDMEFWIRANHKYGMGLVLDSVVHVRKHERQASNYLNFKGELVKQAIEIQNGLYRELAGKYAQHRTALKHHVTISIDAFHRSAAWINSFRGSSDYRKYFLKAIEAAEWSFKFKPRTWLIFLFSLGARIGRGASGKRLIKKLQPFTPVSQMG